MALFNSLTFDGVNSLDSGIYITGEAVYNAPQRQVEMVTIPGRNGTLAIDQGRFENIEVTYPAGCFADDQTDFAEKVRAFRNELASRFGYKRLVDTYHPDEFRLGTYSAGLEVGAVGYHRAGEFDITFDCKPQRFLVSGEEAVTIGEWGETETATGDIVEIDNPDGTLGVKSLLVTLEPIQDLNGYDKPWSGGAGKNKLRPTTASTQTINGIVWTVNADGSIKAEGTATERSIFYYLPSGTYDYLDGSYRGALLDKNGQVIPTGISTINTGFKVGDTWGGFNNVPFALDGNLSQVWFSIDTLNVAVDYTFFPILYDASLSASPWEPYSNICPISGRTEVQTIVSPTTSAEDGDTYTTTLGQTVYGGSLDVVSGELVIDRAMVDLGTLSWVYQANLSRFYTTGIRDTSAKPASLADVNAICSAYTLSASGNNGTFLIGTDGTLYIWDSSYADATSFKNGVNGQTLVYELATPQTIQLTPQEVELLLGQNNVWSDGEVTIEYGLLPNIIINPTLFASSPLLVVTGSGTLSIGNQTLTIASGSADQVIYIDCDSQEAWEVVGGGKLSRNDYIQNAGEAFPVLSPGANAITLGTGITELDITPRWWRV